MKKGAFSLSVNAIVILILAIVMLGLGVTFIRNMFTKAAGQIEEMVSAEPEPQAPYRSDPITVSREHIITTSGETEVIKVSVYNSWGQGSPSTPSGPTPFNCGQIPILSAGTSGSDGATLWINDWWNSDNLCRDVRDTGSAQMCNDVAVVCQATAAAAGKTCTDLAIATTITTPAANVLTVVGNDGNDNYVQCEALGCGPASGGACTDLSGSPTGPAGGNATPEIWCSNADILNNIESSLQTYTKPIPPGDTGTYNLIFDVGSIATRTYLCQVRLMEQPTYSKDFVIDVRRN
jgi:hypothetical protein